MAENPDQWGGNGSIETFSQGNVSKRTVRSNLTKGQLWGIDPIPTQEVEGYEPLWEGPQNAPLRPEPLWDSGNGSAPVPTSAIWENAPDRDEPLWDSGGNAWRPLNQIAVPNSETTIPRNDSHCAYLRENQQRLQAELLEAEKTNNGDRIDGLTGQLESINASLAADCGGGQGSTNGGAASSDPGEGPQSGPYIWKQEGGAGGGSSHRSLMGANLDIVQALDLVEFQRDGTAPLGKGPGSEMRNATAYIRRWKRANTSQQSQVSPDNVSDVVDLGNADTVNAIVANSWTQPALLNGSSIANFNAEAYDFDTVFSAGSQTNTFNTSEIWNSDVINNNITGQDWSKLSQEVPTNAFIESSSSPTAGAPATPTPVSTDQTNPAPGKVISANPGGGGNNGFLSRLTRNLLNIASPSPIYSGAFTDQKAKTSTLQEGVWQFLFNPSELQLRAGPEYAKAQVWGVSDKANSGQPRHWTNNRNPELKFNKVLLNGYVFGRQVEELEQGLFDLFMSRDGGGQDGPDVLEFVWGKRVFGPCIIKDIEVTEKAWDNGLVVNAEVSFTLEQIPEWTINDGAVSVYNPSQLPLSNAQSLLSSAAGTVGAGTTSPGGAGAPSPDGGGGGGSPDQKDGGSNQGELSQLTAEEKSFYRKCQNAQNVAENFAKISEKIKPSVNPFSSNFTTSKQEIRAAMTKYINLYNSMKSKWGREFTSKITNSQAEPKALKQSVEIGLDRFKNLPETRGTNELSQVALFVSNAANSGSVAMKKISDGPRCQSIRKKADDITKKQSAQFKEQIKKQKKCNALRAGSPCSSKESPNASPGSRSQTCAGTKIICGRDGFWKNAANYK